MPSLSGHPVAMSKNFYTSSADPLHALGSVGMSDDGRWYRYVKAGATLVAGNVLQGPPIIPNHLATTATATPAGSTALVFTPAGTGAAANYYADGILSVSDSAGAGYTYGVQSHGTITSSTAFTLTLKPDDPIQVALTTGSRLGLIPNKYNGVIQFPVTTATGPVVGVAPYIITSGQYGWVQTKGPCTVLISGTPALGAIVMTPSAVAGSAIILTTTNLVVAQVVGRMLQIGVDTKQNVVDLDID